MPRHNPSFGLSQIPAGSIAVGVVILHRFTKVPSVRLLTMCNIRIGGEVTEFLLLTLHARTHPNAIDYDDGNWVDCTVAVAAGSFQGSLNRSLRTDELARFREQLARLHDFLTGEAILDTMEHWLRIRMQGDGRGQIEACCHVCDDPVFGNVLDCRLSLDQTYLPTLLRQLEKALQAYPVI
jgi:hypothetical protein